MPPNHQLHTYHHPPCSTLLLCSPYALPTLPRRAPPSLDRAMILPMPALGASDEATNHDPTHRAEAGEAVLPSLLSKDIKPSRRGIVVRRSDGFEKRREWRCGRCGGVVGYEIVGPGVDKGDDGGGARSGEDGGQRVMYFFEGALEELEGEEREIARSGR